MTLAGWSTLRHRDFALVCAARFAVMLALQMTNVAIGWYIYDVTGSAFALGMLGIAGFAPTIVLVLLTGLAADRIDRRLIMFASDLVLTGATIVLLWLVASGQGIVWPVYVILVLVSASRAFHNPAGQAIIPGLVPQTQLGQAIAFAAGSLQSAQIIGPALGGIFYAIDARLPFLVGAVLYAGSAFAVLTVKARPVETTRKTPVTLRSLMAGFEFAWNRQVVLGAMLLDTVVVMFAGVVLLLPIFAKDILGVGPVGLGLMRAAPAVGAVGMAVWLSGNAYVQRRAGVRLLQTIAAYGAATAMFGLSTSFLLSLACLVAAGASDMISMVIRHTMVQAETPDDLRGRVSAVNSLFITASSELGQFRAGIVAGLLGAMPAAVIGGLTAIGVALLWPRIFPELRARDHLVAAEGARA